MLGDIVGSSGRSAVAKWLPDIKRSERVDLVVANGENAAHGFGMTPQIVKELFRMGIDVITGGNHTWDKKEIIPLFSEFPDRILRPHNYPKVNPGKGWTIVKTPFGVKVGIINVMGRIFMDPVDCPFQSFESIIDQMREETSIIIVDIHAETSSEKSAFAYFVDGRVSAVVGTHTHVQTADERVLNRGTGFLTDLGMNGPIDSVIGMKKEIIIDRFVKKVAQKMDVADGPGIFQGALIKVDLDTGRCLEIQRLQRK